MSEYILGRNALIILLVIQLTALLFGSLTLNTLNGINCTPNQIGNTAICNLNRISSGINSTTHSLAGSFNCMTNNTGNNPNCWLQSPAPTANANCWLVGCPLNQIGGVLIFVANGIIAVAYAIGYIFYLIGQMIYLVIFLLTGFFPLLFGSTGVFPAGLGYLFGAVFSITTLIMLVYLIYLIVNRLPFLGGGTPHNRRY